MKNLAVYQLNALLQWIGDSGLEPQLTISNGEGVQFPRGFEAQPQVTWKVSNAAVINFVLDDEGVSFGTKIGGVPVTVYAPLKQLVAVSSSDGKIFIPLGMAEEPLQGNPQASEPETKPVAVKPSLTLIKGGAQGDGIPRGKLKLV